MQRDFEKLFRVEKVAHGPKMIFLHRAFSLIGIPVILAFLLWIAQAADQVRNDVALLKATIPIEIRQLQEGNRQLAADQQRIWAFVWSDRTSKK